MEVVRVREEGKITPPPFSQFTEARSTQHGSALALVAPSVSVLLVNTPFPPHPKSNGGGEE